MLLQQEKLLVQGVQASLEAMYSDCPATLQLHSKEVVARGQGGSQGLARGQGGSQGVARGQGVSQGLGQKRGIMEAFSNEKKMEQNVGKKQKVEQQRTLSSFFTVRGGGDQQDLEPEENDYEEVLEGGDCKAEQIENYDNKCILEPEEDKENIAGTAINTENSTELFESSQNEIGDGFQISFDYVETKEEKVTKRLDKEVEVEGLKITFECPAEDSLSESLNTREVVEEGLKISFDSFPVPSKHNGGDVEATRTDMGEGVNISFDTFPSSARTEDGDSSDGISRSDTDSSRELVAEGLKISFDSFPVNHAIESVDEKETSIEPLEVIKSPICKEAPPTLTIDDSVELRSNRKKAVTVSFSLESLKESLSSSNANEAKKNTALKFKAKIEPGENRSAEEELSKQIQKSDFAQMEIFGQFNLGFLIVGLESDLFIVDQHATDEKYNFETLQRTTHLKPQRMVVPQVSWPSDLFHFLIF